MLIVLQSCPAPVQSTTRNPPLTRAQGATYRASIVGSVVFSLRKIAKTNRESMEKTAISSPRPHTLGRCDHGSVRSRLLVSLQFRSRARPTPVGMNLPSVAPGLLETLALVKPTTALERPRKGFLMCRRRRSCCPRWPKTSDEIHDRSIERTSPGRSVTHAAFRANCSISVLRSASPRSAGT
jgi:hypothetical protein